MEMINQYDVGKSLSALQPLEKSRLHPYGPFDAPSFFCLYRNIFSVFKGSMNCPDRLIRYLFQSFLQSERPTVPPPVFPTPSPLCPRLLARGVINYNAFWFILLMEADKEMRKKAIVDIDNTLWHFCMRCMRNQRRLTATSPPRLLGRTGICGKRTVLRMNL